MDCETGTQNSRETATTPLSLSAPDRHQTAEYLQTRVDMFLKTLWELSREDARDVLIFAYGALETAGIDRAIANEDTSCRSSLEATISEIWYQRCAQLCEDEALLRAFTAIIDFTLEM